MSMYPGSGAQQRKPWELEYGAYDRPMARFFNTVYAWMAVGLAVTASVAWFVSQSPAALHMVYGGGPAVMVVMLLAMFAIAWSVQTAAMRINANVATGLFLLYSALMGALLSSIFIMYKLPTIGAAFVMTGGTFAAMSIYGFVTKRDLTRIGSFLVMAFVGLFIASLINLFVASSAFSWFITYAVLAVFIGITAYETQKLKVLAAQYGDNPAIAPRIAIIGSLLLYIAFINMFLSILRIMGDRR
jgi:FtsH-binding integral membrane protein